MDLHFLMLMHFRHNVNAILTGDRLRTEERKDNKQTAVDENTLLPEVPKVSND